MQFKMSLMLIRMIWITALNDKYAYNIINKFIIKGTNNWENAYNSLQY